MSLLECRDVLLLLTKRLEGNVHAEMEARIEDHLKQCCSCRVAFVSAGETMARMEQGWSPPRNGDGRDGECKENGHD